MTPEEIERLNQIKQHHMLYRADESARAIEYLLDLCERLQADLEHEQREHKRVRNQRNKSRANEEKAGARIAELAEALQFYADPETYKATITGISNGREYIVIPLEDDWGLKARAALAAPLVPAEEGK